MNSSRKELIDEFRRVWNRNSEMEIPPHGKMKWKRDFKALYTLWESFKVNGKSTRLAALETASLLSKCNIPEWPDFESLSDDLIVADQAQINNYFNTIHGPKGINHLANKHLLRPASQFMVFKSVEAFFGNTGATIFRDEKVDPVSMRLLKKSHLSTGKAKPIKSAVFCYDRLGSQNICHFLYDTVGRYLELVETLDLTDCEKPLLILMRGTINPYQKYILDILQIDYLSVIKVNKFRFDVLYVSCAVTGDFAEGFAHPARVGEKKLLTLMRNRLLNSVQIREGGGKYYISRDDASVRPVNNEKDVVELLEKRGFEKVIMSQLSPEQQLSLFARASDIVAPHGAGLTSMVVAPVGCRITELMHPHKATAAYAIIARTLGFEHRILETTPIADSENFSSEVPLKQLEEML